MALEPQVISINMGGGIDSKTDPKLVVPGKFTLLENAVQISAKQWRKRNGNDLMTSAVLGGGNLANPSLVHEFKNELVCADSGSLYSYSPDASAWASKGFHESVGVSRLPVSIKSFSQSQQSMAVLGNFALIVWSEPSVTIAGYQTHYSVIDIASNTQIVSDFALGTNISALPCPKAFVIGGANLAVAYLDGSNHLVVQVLTISGSGASFAAAVTIASDVVKYSGVNAIQYDIVGTSSGAVFAYSKSTTFSGSPTDVITKTIDTSGTVTHTATLSAVGLASPISVTFDSANGNAWVYWSDTTTPSNSPLYYAVFSSTLSTVLGKTTITTGLKNPSQVCAVKISTTQQTVFFSSLSADATLAWYNTAAKNVTSAGVVSSNSFLAYGLDIFSKPFTVSGNNYLACFYLSSTQGTVFLFDTGKLNSLTSAPYVAAKCLYSVAPKSSLTPSFLSSPASISATQIGFAFPFVAYNFSQNNTNFQNIGTTQVIFDFANVDAYQALQISDSLILNGGVVSMYDGAAVSELGFHLYPEIKSSSVGTGGSIVDGIYGYYVVYKWIDAQGKIHRSATAAINVTVSGKSGGGQVTLGVTPLTLTQKDWQTTVGIEIYRTTSSGVAAFLVGTTIGYSADSIVSVIDGSADSSIQSSEELYINGGVLENNPPPPSLVLGKHNNRLWLIDAENPSSAWYSKSIGSGAGISMSGLLLVNVEATGGDIKAMTEMDDKFIFFKSEVPFYVAGDGAGDDGTGSTLTTPSLIPSDVGCVDSRSAIAMPTGVIFKSAKGIYLLDRSMSVSYFGAEVEGYNSQNIKSAIRVKDKTHVRFLTDSGSSLVFDYVFNQWSVFTNYNGISAAIWNGLYVYVRTDGTIFKENTTSFLDNSTAYALRAKTGALKLAGVQGFQRVRRAALLGDYANGSSGAHGVQISAAYDFGTTFSTPIPYVFGASGSSSSFQYRERLPLQKCDALTLLIEEITTGASGEYVDLTDLSLEVGIKRGINKLSAAKTVG